MTTPTPRQDAPTPYRDAALAYRDAGWLGVIPIPLGTKTLRKVGWTGRQGAWPSTHDIHAWCDNTHPDEGGGNVALRLPPDVIGIDVDAYDGKQGAATLAATETRYGPLPPTWRTTSRDDRVSGIRLFKAPEGLNWPGQVGPGIETVHTVHRYAMVWPSLHPEGRTYRWITPEGATSTVPPREEDLPELPDQWVIGLTGGQLAEDVTIADLSTGEAQAWIIGTPPGPTCRAMQTVLQRLLAELQSGSAHESLRRLLGLTRLAEQGHTGLLDALAQVHTAFLNEVTTPSRSGSVRDKSEADHEWQRSLAGAVRRVVGNPSVAPDDTPPDPCTNPFAGLITTVAGRAALAPLPLVDPAPAQPTPPATAGVSDEAAERTTWWPRDLGPTLAGEATEPPPAVLARDDGHCLFYAGKVNGLLGESESGKTWVLLAGVAQELAAQRPVLYVDFEDTSTGIITRLRSLGVPDWQLEPTADLFTYIAPEEALHTLASSDLAEVLARKTYSLVALDGVNAAMTLLGLDLTSNTDATRFAQLLLRPLARTGAAVVAVDHVPKDKESRGKGGIGAQAKRAMVTGCALTVEVLAPFGRGSNGKLRLTVDKDRPGHVRGAAAFSKNAGTVLLESDKDTEAVRVVIEKPDSRPIEQRDSFRPTGIMAAVSRYLQRTEGELSQRQIEASIEGRSTWIRAALDCLVAEGFVARHPGPGVAVLHQHVRLYQELSDLVGDESDG